MEVLAVMGETQHRTAKQVMEHGPNMELAELL